MKKEAINQCVHTFVGFVVGSYAYQYTHNPFYIIALIACLAFVVEILQYFFLDKRRLFIEDRVLDISFYILGAVLSMLGS